SQVWGWAYQILPYIEQNNVWKDPVDDNVKAFPIPTYFCPTRRGPTVWDFQPGLSGSTAGPRATLDYGGNQGSVTNGDKGMLIKVGRPFKVNVATVTDGTSNTMMVAERWMTPAG